MRCADMDGLNICFENKNTIFPSEYKESDDSCEKCACKRKRWVKQYGLLVITNPLAP